MKKLGIFVSLLLFCSVYGLYAQSNDAVFRVLANHGKNQLNETPIKIGAAIQSDDQITIAENGYLGLGHHSGKTLELRKQGTYKVSELVKEIKDEDKSMNTRFFDYLIDELTQQSKENQLKQRYKYMSKAGGQVRKNEPVVFHTPPSTQVLSKKAFISWFVAEEKQAEQEPELFTLYILNEFGEELQTIEVKGRGILVDLMNEKLKGSNIFTYKVVARNHTHFYSDEHLIRRMSQKKIEKKYADYRILRYANNALGKVILAKYFEEEGLILDAITAYQEAILLAPEVQMYQELYQEFLERANLGKTMLNE